MTSARFLLLPLLLPLGACSPPASTLPKIETKRAKVERGDIILHVQATGEIKPVKEVELKSKASGQVVRFQKLPGDSVEEGELIAELDKRVEQRNLTLPESNLMSAEANLALVKLAAAPVDDAANDELIALLSKTLKVPKRDITIVRGERSPLALSTVKR